MGAQKTFALGIVSAMTRLGRDPWLLARQTLSLLYAYAAPARWLRAVSRRQGFSFDGKRGS